MPRYIVFVFSADKANGGWADVLSDSKGKPVPFSSLPEAMKAGRASPLPRRKYQVVDLTTLKLVAAGSR